MIFLSGCIPSDQSGNIIGQSSDGSYDIVAQTKQALSNLDKVLSASGTSKDKVVKAVVFLKSMDDFAKVNEVYSAFFDSAPAPARSCVQVAKLPKDVAVEIEAIALE